MKDINVMVCVTQQRTCERLILRGHKLIKSENDNLYVIHVVNEKGMFLEHHNDGEALEYLFDVSKKAGANLTVLRSKDIMKTMVEFAGKAHISHIVIGARPEEGEVQDQNFGLNLKKALPNIEFLTL